MTDPLAPELGLTRIVHGKHGGDNKETHFTNVTRMKCLLKCALSLNEEEAQVLSFLITHGRGAIAKEIAEALGRNPEVVRRALRGLYARNLVVRKPYPLRKGGRAYMYEVPHSLVETLMDICSRVDALIKSVAANKQRQQQ